MIHIKGFHRRSFSILPMRNIHVQVKPILERSPTLSVYQLPSCVTVCEGFQTYREAYLWSRVFASTFQCSHAIIPLGNQAEDGHSIILEGRFQNAILIMLLRSRYVRTRYRIEKRVSQIKI